MLEEQFREQIDQVESLLCQLQGILAVKIILDGQDITEVHVLADHLRNPKQLVRDIETVFKIKSDLFLDHRKISIVQIPKTLAVSGRLKLASTQLNSSAGQAEVVVELLSGDQLFKGQAKGPNSSSNRLRLAAKATVQAIELFLGTPDMFVVEEVTGLTLRGQPTIVVYLTRITGNAEETLLGIAVEKTDVIEATAKSVLCAINRKLVKTE